MTRRDPGPGGDSGRKESARAAASPQPKFCPSQAVIASAHLPHSGPFSGYNCTRVSDEQISQETARQQTAGTVAEQTYFQHSGHQLTRAASQHCPVHKLNLSVRQTVPILDFLQLKMQKVLESRKKT